MEYLVALLTTLALHLPALTGQPAPDLSVLPSFEVVSHLEQAVFSHTGHRGGGTLTTAVYLPRENVILLTAALLDDPQELEAVLVHELVHWWQVHSRQADPRGGPMWEEVARYYENLWRKEHGLRLRPSPAPPYRRRP
jgi:Zn-dependent protease with chaperone function